MKQQKLISIVWYIKLQCNSHLLPCLLSKTSLSRDVVCFYALNNSPWFFILTEEFCTLRITKAYILRYNYYSSYLNYLIVNTIINNSVVKVLEGKAPDLFQEEILKENWSNNSNVDYTCCMSYIVYTLAHINCYFQRILFIHTKLILHFPFLVFP